MTGGLPTNQWIPGPWRVEPRPFNRGNRIFIIASHGDHPNGFVAAVESYPFQWHREANAHLIAAAPDLYEALQTMLKRYVDLAGSGDCGNWNPEEEAQVIAARAALAKARGETP